MQTFIGILLLAILYPTSARNFYGNFIPGARNIGFPRRPSPAPTPVSNRGRVCRYGVNYWDCCQGWKRDQFGKCNPLCQKECLHGDCVAPDRCECHEGWMGPTCEKDFNECAVRPCQHRCMNQPGSYRCYCEHGYALMPDRHRCQRDKRCLSKHCSFACRRKGRKIECACPPGWELAPDGKNCRDIDECSTGVAKCGPDLRCRNSMGDYICLCPLGKHYEYNTLLKKYKCETDKGCGQDPCFQGVTCTPQAKFNIDPRNPVPDNVDLRLYRCGPCPEGFEGDGETCTPKVRITTEQSTLTPRKIVRGNSTATFQSRTPFSNSTGAELVAPIIGVMTLPAGETGETTKFSRRPNVTSEFDEANSGPIIVIPYYPHRTSTTSASSKAQTSTSLPKTSPTQTTVKPTTTPEPTTTNIPTTTVQPTTTPIPTTTLAPTTTTLLTTTTPEPSTTTISTTTSKPTSTKPTTTPEPTITTVPPTTLKPTTSTMPTTTPEPTTTKLPTTTLEPTTTTLPTTTAEPTTTTIPTTTPEPTTTKILTTTPEPTTTTVPTTTAKPTTTMIHTTTPEPTTTTIPTTTPEPTTTVEPTTTTIPTTTPEPTTTTIPTTTLEPTTTTVPTTTAKPTTTMIHTTTPEPTTTKIPTTTPEPTTTAEPTTTTIPTTTPEPTTTTIPTTTPEPTTTTEPTTTAEPTTTTIPTTTPEPTTTKIPTTTLEPTTTTVPTTTAEPTTTTIPTTTPEPTTTKIPTTTLEPTTTTIPTTTPEPTTTTIPTTTPEATTTPKPTTTPEPTTTPVISTTPLPPQEIVISTIEANEDEIAIPNTDVALYRFDKRSNLMDPLSGVTDDDGLLALPVPEGEHFVIYVYKPGYIGESKTLMWVPFGRNMLTFKLRSGEDARMEETITWYSGFTKFLHFEAHGVTYDMEILAGALDVEEGTRATITCLPVNVSDPEDLKRAPELLGNSLSPKKNGGNVTHGLEVYGMAEFRVERADTSEDVVTEPLDVLRAVKMEIPITGSTEDLSNFQQITAWYFDESMGYWREEGSGTIRIKEGKWQWEYYTKRFTWWAVGRKFMETSCAIVRTCYDPDCNEPAPFIPVTMAGTNFAYVTQKLTDVKGKTCFNFKLGGQVRFSSHCDPQPQFVDVKSKKKSPLCCHDNFGRQLVKHYVKSKKKSNKCTKVTIHISDSSISNKCPDPSIGAEKGVEYSYTGRAVGSIATASCTSKRREIDGEDTHTCLECGRWSGSQPQCKKAPRPAYFRRYESRRSEKRL